ncbi:MAG: metal ABC transporter substrate-binding protein [Pseudomonadales bacterium]|nr:metal ABC transporter substrate-binding protein [Pseudomonadales bacterium]
MRRLWLIILLLTCSPAWSQTIVASVEPLAKLLRSLYGPSVEVETLMQANQNPHQLALSPRQAMQVRQADLVVWLGAGVEAPLAPLVARREMPSVALLDLVGVERREGGHVHHDHDDHDHHDESGAHHNANLDPHLWLSVHNMQLLAAAAASAMPEGLQKGQPAVWLTQADAVLTQLREQLAPQASTAWLSYHQPWGYFSDVVGLAEPVQVSQQLDAGPGSRRFVALAQEIRDREVHCMIVEPEARAAMLQRLCPDCEAVALDPLGRDQLSLNYLPWLKTLGNGFQRCLQAGS